LKQEDIIATDLIGGTTYEYRVARDPMPDAPQLTHRIQFRRETSVHWENAMMGGYIDRDHALTQFIFRYRGDLRNLTPIHPTIKAAMAEELERRRKKEAQEQAQTEEERRTQENRAKLIEQIDKMMKKTHFTKMPVPGEENEKGYKYGTFCICKTFTWKKPQLYHILHIPSDARVTSTGIPLKHARIMAVRLSQLMDWNITQEQITNHPERPKIVQAVRRLHCDPYADLSEIINDRPQ